MTTESRERIRRAAVLIASIDQSLGERLLSSLPSDEAGMVRNELLRLGDIDPQERRLVLDAFRRGELTPRSTNEEAPVSQLKRSSGGVELAITADAERRTSLPTEEQRRVHSALDMADVDVVAEILNQEHAQTVAVVLSRMSDDRAAEVFAALQDDVKPDVLGRLSSLDQADEQAVVELESHICRWAEEQRQRRQRAQAGVELVGRILAKTPDADRAALMLRMTRQRTTIPDVPAEAVDQVYFGVGRGGPSDSMNSDNLSTSRRVAETPPKHPFPDPIVQGKSGSDDPNETTRFETDASGYGADGLDDRSDLIAQLDDAALMRSLAAVDESTARLALAGSSEAVLNRVLKMLPWRRARALRRQLRKLPPTPVAELRLAQRAVLHRSQPSATNAGNSAAAA